MNKLYFCFFFFFQAEDGIRDGRVTGVQTCALPIWSFVRDAPRAACPSTRPKAETNLSMPESEASSMDLPIVKFEVSVRPRPARRWNATYAAWRMLVAEASYNRFRLLKPRKGLASVPFWTAMMP